MERVRRVASNLLLVTDYGRPDTWGVEFQNVRVVAAHMIVETATHAGHLDAAVELPNSSTDANMGCDEDRRGILNFAHALFAQVPRRGGWT